MEFFTSNPAGWGNTLLLAVLGWLVFIQYNDRKEARRFQSEILRKMDEEHAALRQEMRHIREEMRGGFAEAAEDRRHIREEMRGGFAEAREDDKALRQEMREDLAEQRRMIGKVDGKVDEVGRQVGGVAVRLARIEGRLEVRVEEPAALSLAAD